MHGFYATPISAHLAETQEKFLIATAVPLARSGYQEYTRAELGLDGDGNEKVTVWRDPSEVLSPKTIFSFEGKPVCGPSHPAIFISPENIGGYQKGHVQHVREGEPLPTGERVLVGDLVITDANLISQVKAHAVREVSAGYGCEYVEMQDPHGPNTVFAQRKISGNHVAIVPRGRAGPDIRIFDADPSVDPTQESVALVPVEVKPNEGGFTMEIKALKDGIADLKEVLAFIGIGPKGGGSSLSLTTDADPGAVERNAEKAEEAKERAVARNKDDLPEALKEKAEEKKEEKKESKDGGEAELKKEEAGAEKPKESKDAAGATDAFDRLCAKMDAYFDARKARDAESEKAEEKKETKKEGEDSELIPVETLPAGDIPKNPIPGAEKSVDAAASTKAALLAIKPVIAASKNQDAAVAWNKAWRSACGKSATDGNKYGDLTKIVKPDEVKNAEARQALSAVDSEAAALSDSSNYAEEMRRFHRRNTNEVNTEKARVN